MQADARLNIAEIARRVHLSKSACLQRIRQLEAHEYILGYHARLDPIRFDLSHIIFVKVGLKSKDHSTLSLFKSAAWAEPAILCCYMLAGDCDFLLKIRCSDIPDFKQYLGQVLLFMPGVVDVDASTVIEEVKDVLALPIG